MKKPYHTPSKLTLFLILSSATLYFSGCRQPTIVIPPKVNDGTQYMFLQEDITTFSRIINDTLAFVYEEEYNVNSLTYRIYGNDGTMLYSNTDRAVNIHYGRNYIQLYLPSDTAPFDTWLNKNPLLLEVTNAKNRQQYLTFNYTAR